MKPKFKILSIDGGGIRGIIPCIMLKFIEEQTGNPISSMFNVISGTSTGGIISLGLTKPDEYDRNMYSAEKMLGLYLDHGKKIFPPREKDILSRISGALFDKPYDASGIESLLLEYFGDTKLKDALTSVLITTYEIGVGKPFYFSSRLAQNDEKENILYREVADLHLQHLPTSSHLLLLQPTATMHLLTVAFSQITLPYLRIVKHGNYGK